MGRGFLGKFIDDVTPWNTGYEASQKREQEMQKIKLEAEIAQKNAAAGILSQADLEALKQKNTTTMYMILGFIVIFVVGIVFYFKSGKR